MNYFPDIPSIKLAPTDTSVYRDPFIVGGPHREQVVTEISEVIENKRPPTPRSMKMTDVSDIKVHSKWFKVYRERRDKGWSSICDKKWKDEQNRKKRIQYDCPILDVTRLPPIKQTTWMKGVWPRNFYCEFCTKVAGSGADTISCRSCNCVIHYTCLKRFKEFRDESAIEDPTLSNWLCLWCQNSINADKGNYEWQHEKHEKALLAFRTAIRLQASARRWMARADYRIQITRLIRAQALIRGKIVRKKFRKLQMQILRIFKIRISDIGDLTVSEGQGVPEAGPNVRYYIIISAIQTKKDIRKIATIEAEKQIIRYECKDFPYKKGRTQKMNQVVVIPGCNQAAILCFTLVKKDGGRHEFWGQSFITVKDLLTLSSTFCDDANAERIVQANPYYIMKCGSSGENKDTRSIATCNNSHIEDEQSISSSNATISSATTGSNSRKVRLNLRECKLDAKDKRANHVIRSRQLENKTISGFITIDATPSDLHDVQCSLVHEVPEGGNEGTQIRLRSWWGVLHDFCHFSLYKKQGDDAPARTMIIVKVWHLIDKKCIRITGMRGYTFNFTVDDLHQRNTWYNKLKRAAEHRISTNISSPLNAENANATST